jgi:hypothetical protein
MGWFWVHLNTHELIYECSGSWELFIQQTHLSCFVSDMDFKYLLAQQI